MNAVYEMYPMMADGQITRLINMACGAKGQRGGEEDLPMNATAK